MKHDLRRDPLYTDTQQFFERAYAGSFGQLAELWDIRGSGDGRWIALSGTSYDNVSSLPRNRIAIFDVAHSMFSMLEGERNDTSPAWSPAGMLAFLSDRAKPDRYAAYLYDPKDGRVKPAATITGVAESVAWAPDGKRFLVQSVNSIAPTDLPDWTPEVEQTVPQDAWRRIWICAADGSSAALLDWIDLTVWEAVWCGTTGIIAVVSENPREAAWFQSRLVYLDLQHKTCETIHTPAYQIGLPCATPDGRYAAIVEGCLSDRGFTAGDALLFDRILGWRRSSIDVGADVTSLCARNNARLSFAGVRDLDVVCGEIAVEGKTAEIQIVSSGAWMRVYPGVAAVDERDYITVVQRYTEPPALVRYDPGTAKDTTLHRFSYAGSAYAIEVAGEVMRRKWNAQDGLEIHGYLARPKSQGPHPLVVFIHGGPVVAYANWWCMNMPVIPVLVRNGYAVLLPNPRGSSGRGQEFVRLVCGDLGGGEADDILSGVQALVDDGIVDARRVALLGGSHGGYLAAALITQSQNFAAAICAFPVTDIFSGNFSAFPSEAMPPFITDSPFDTGGQFFTRSPLLSAQKVRTPVLVIAGAQDRVIGVTQGLEFHRALAQCGATSELVTYPLEGHGVRNTAAYIDYCTRILCWLKTYCASEARSRTS